MANPQGSGTFDYWITDQFTFSVLPPSSGNTGDLEKWIIDSLYFNTYLEAPATDTGNSIQRTGQPFFQI